MCKKHPLSYLEKQNFNTKFLEPPSHPIQTSNDSTQANIVITVSKARIFEATVIQHGEKQQPNFENYLKLS